MVIKRDSFLTILLVLSMLLASLTFALTTVVAEEDINLENGCYLEASNVERYWCGPDNKYYWGTYDVYTCEFGRQEWRLIDYEIVSDYCPYF